MHTVTKIDQLPGWKTDNSFFAEQKSIGKQNTLIHVRYQIFHAVPFLFKLHLNDDIFLNFVYY
jgi:hypothetical protein